MHRANTRGSTALKQMGYPDTFVEEEDEEAAYSAVPAGDAIEGFVDEIEPKYDDDRDLSFKDVQEHPEREQLLEAARKELKQWTDMDVGEFPGEEELEKVRLGGERILRARMIYKRKYETVVGSDNVARERFVKWKARCAVIGCPEIRSRPRGPDLVDFRAYHRHDGSSNGDIYYVRSFLRCEELRLGRSLFGH